MASESKPADQKTVPYQRIGDERNQDQNSMILKRPIILGDLTLASPTTFTTVGANGTASALTANPVGYIVVVIGNTSVQIPYYNLA